MKDYLNNTKIPKFQVGGPAPSNINPEAEIQAMLQQAVESQDAQLALQVCNAIYEMTTGAAPAQQQGSPAMPVPGAPVPGGVPMGRYGMKVGVPPMKKK